MHSPYDVLNGWKSIPAEKARTGDKYLVHDFRPGSPGWPAAWVPYVKSVDGELPKGTLVRSKRKE
jgi:hypothetical protein